MVSSFLFTLYMLMILEEFFIFLPSKLRSPNMSSSSCCHSVPWNPAAVLSVLSGCFFCIWMRKDRTELQSVLKMPEHYGIIQWQSDTTDVFCSVFFSDNSIIKVLWVLVCLRPLLNIELTFYRTVYCSTSLSFLTGQIQEHFAVYIKLVLFYPICSPLSRLNFRGCFIMLTFTVVNAIVCSWLSFFILK